MTTETSTTPTATPLAVTSHRPVGPRTWVATAVVNVVTAVLGVMFLVPLLWVVFAAFDARAGLKLEWPGTGFSFDNFRAVLTPETTYRPMWNGLVLCVGSTFIAIVVATLAAYPLSRFETRYKRPFLLTILFSTGLPITAIMVPVYGLFVQLNLVDTIGGTVAFMATTALPMSIFLCKNFMDGVPLTLEEAAWTDGASSMQTLRHIVLPLMWPGLSVVTIFTFIGMWGNFFIPFVLLLSPDRLPASVSIFTFFGQYGSVQWGQLAAYSVLYTLPVVVLYVLLSRRLGGAFNFGGALKG
ncbi:carbohydrate ABC transporter permease [Kineococcus aurantiacus]|uniref:Multiple sugar transport system permease protein n=1 Tax=Kineococcus aurantiacus TaxID=37633 RepID=A0A7Y9DP84_9ACTN|nr:carbohydrate ABC transporter permease [Kineococcus aurantiacus]NYD24251.1 multiple sugar transport system permease protein [Kineococcus aurantiacus]NYD25067.1 multiple sugar transport system permease protein [Kineococcus aurantiacus]